MSANAAGLAPMKWLETKPDFEVPPAITASFLLKAIEKHPNNPAMRERLGDVLLQCNKFADALNAYETAARQAPRDFRKWAKLARCYRALGRPEAALDVAHRCEASGGVLTARLHFQRGCALQELRRFSEAKCAFIEAMSAEHHLPPLKRLLKPLARKTDGDELLEFCESLPQHYTDTALVRANRAIALSRIGRTAEALQIVDLKRHVSQVQIAVPSKFDGLEQFNRELADGILEDQSTARASREGVGVDYEPRLRRHQAMIALREFIKSAIAQYLNEMKARGLDQVMPPPPATGRLFDATVVLTGDGCNGEHIHEDGYVSAVYYAMVPDIVIAAGDNRGALALGVCEEYTGGYVPCWGTRFIHPKAGWLTIFPSHVYHDVVPTRVQSPRISVAADLQPC
jgi:tetratricopeptide (TPR) repeat protein